MTSQGRATGLGARPLGRRGDGGVLGRGNPLAVWHLGARGDGAPRRGRPHPKNPGLQLRVAVEGDLDGAAGLVALRVGVLLRSGDQLVGEGLLVAGEAFEVGAGQLDRVEVRHHRAAVAHHGGAVVHRAADRGGELDRLDLGLERLGKGAVDRSLQAALDLVEQSHSPTPRCLTSMVDVPVGGRFIVTVTRIRTGEGGTRERFGATQGDAAHWSPRASGGMADALASGASARKGVGVQVPPRAPTHVIAVDCTPSEGCNPPRSCVPVPSWAV